MTAIVEDVRRSKEDNAASPSARILLVVAPVVSDLPLNTPRGMDNKSRIISSVRASRFVAMVSSCGGLWSVQPARSKKEWTYREMNLNILVI